MPKVKVIANPFPPQNAERSPMIYSPEPQSAAAGVAAHAHGGSSIVIDVNPFPFFELPVEMQIAVLEHLDPSSLGRVAASCKQMHRLTSDDFLWKLVWARHFSEEKDYVEKLSLGQNLCVKQLFSERWTLAVCIGSWA